MWNHTIWCQLQSFGRWHTQIEKCSVFTSLAWISCQVIALQAFGLGVKGVAAATHSQTSAEMRTIFPPWLDRYNAATRQRKGLSTSNDPADFDSNIDKARHLHPLPCSFSVWTWGMGMFLIFLHSKNLKKNLIGLPYFIINHYYCNQSLSHHYLIINNYIPLSSIVQGTFSSQTPSYGRMSMASFVIRSTTKVATAFRRWEH